MEGALPIGAMITGKRLELARLQDVVVEIVYRHVQSDALLYGGTAIWRCYSGARFSDDIDIYVGKSFEHGFTKALDMYGLVITWRDKDPSTRMRISDGNAELLFEAKAGKAEGILAQYRKVDGSAMTVYTLSPSELLKRKIEAYEGRRYMRDVYDMMQLTNFLDRKDHYVRQNLEDFLKAAKKPVDEKILASLLYEGSGSVSFNDIMKYLKSWLG